MHIACRHFFRHYYPIAGGGLMDDADRAQIKQERQLDRAIAAARGVRGTTVRVTECVECGEAIEPVRVDHGFATCAECARWLERLRLGGAV